MKMNIEQITNVIQNNLEIFWLYLPLGIIGVWRWSVWVFRRGVANYYLAPKGDYRGALSVVTPVYNENPNLFRPALDSWKRNGVDEIIAVIDYSDEKNIALFREFQKDFSGAQLIVTEKPGKRPALADGIRASKSEIVALVDSDTVWSPNIKNKLTGPFADSAVGGLVTRQDVLKTDTLARKLFKILLDDRYLLEYPFLATVSDALLCLSGRTAVYRKKAIIDKLDILVNETFWGSPMISGDDKTLTRLVHQNGWKTRYLRDVRVYTSGVPRIGQFMKQKLRWTRNGLRSDSKILFSGWIWKRHKMLALHMLDKFVSPLALLLGPVFFATALALGHWPVAIAMLLWWLVSRAVKLYPHLKEKPGDFFILPDYILMTFVMAVVKVYALVTVDEQGWITRWDKARLASVNFFRRALSYGATGSLILILFFAIFNYKNNVLIAAQAEKQRIAEIKETERIRNLYAFMTPDLPKMSDADLEKIETELASKAQSDPYGYYVVKPGDTVAGLRQKFNIPATGRILRGSNKTALGNFTPLGVGQQLAIPRADLRNPISRNIVAPSMFRKPSRVNYEAASNTIFVRQSGSVATLSRIRLALPLANRNLLEQTAAGEWILRANLYVGQDVTLVLDGSEVKYMKLKSDDTGFVWVRSQNGNILISNTKITSWDEKAGAPDMEYASGRAYITAKSSGRMDVVNSEIAYLGYAGLPKRGGPFGGSYGISWKNNNNAFRDRLLTGVVTGNKFHHNYFGLYTFGVTGMLIRSNEAYENIEYGLDPHDDSNNMLIAENKAYRNGNHGIIISRRCFQNAIIGNESYDNRLHGIMLDRQSDNNLVQGNEVYGNVDGIVVYDSDNNVVLENDARGNEKGVRLNAGSSGNFVRGNDFSDNSRGIYIYDQSAKNTLVKNVVKGNEIGITIKNASENSLFDNFQRFDNKKDGRITDGSAGNNIQ
ncbi:MAG: LysM protein [Patescibacteria group bacterium]|nr:LysM protein [Patescibacteria group bacterium]